MVFGTIQLLHEKIPCALCQLREIKGSHVKLSIQGADLKFGHIATQKSWKFCCRSFDYFTLVTSVMDYYEGITKQKGLLFR